MGNEGAKQDAAERRTAKPRATLRSRGFTALAAVIFGFALPVAILYQAYSAMEQLGETLRSADGFPLLDKFPKLQPHLTRPEDYMLASQIVAESASQRTMINKQVMKASAMHVGFATMSLGLMLVLLGFKEYQQAQVTAGGITVDLRRVTSGALVFLAGSAMTAAAALTPNEYRTVSPFYFSVENPSGAEAPAARAADDYTRPCINWHPTGSDALANCLDQAEEKRIVDLAKSGKLEIKTCIDHYQQRAALLELCMEGVGNAKK